MRLSQELGLNGFQDLKITLTAEIIHPRYRLPGSSQKPPRSLPHPNRYRSPTHGTRFPADIVSKKDFDFKRQEGDIGSMDYDQAVKNGRCV